ncbi:MAG: hypothetical protein PWP74_54 [Shewanella sp.]|nr:hypothetical protein [Shewanella sp.]
MTIPANEFAHYHAHLYFDETTQEFAAELHYTISHELGLPVGPFNTRLVGPHLCWSFETAFTQTEFPQFVPWMDRHRRGLSVMIHAVTGAHYHDHTQHIFWLGNPKPLNLNVFNPSVAAD